MASKLKEAPPLLILKLKVAGTKLMGSKGYPHVDSSRGIRSLVTETGAASEWLYYY